MISQTNALTSSPQTSGGIIRAVLADDEHLAREKLRWLLAREPNIEIVAECRNGKQTIDVLRRLEADLLFLDIRMPDLDGFEVLSDFSLNERPVVVFTTAYDQYAIRAFEACALDYLLKPFDQDRLHRTIERVRLEMNKSRDREIAGRVLNLLRELNSEVLPANLSDGRLIFKTKGRVIFFNLDEIEWIEAAANYVRLNVGKETHLVREPIGRISERLDPSHFVRIHRSTLVNVNQIKELIPVNSGEYVVVLKNGKELSCSRGYRVALEGMIQKRYPQPATPRTEM